MTTIQRLGKGMGLQSLCRFLGICLFLLIVFPADAKSTTLFWDTFSDPSVIDHYVLGDRGVPKSYGTTYFDGDDRLQITIDRTGPSESFYRIQGINRRIGPNNDFWNNPVNTGFQVDLYFDPDWLHGGLQREIAFWAQLTGTIRYWPALGFYTDGFGNAHFYTWPEPYPNDEYLMYHAVPSDFQYGWNTITYLLTETGNTWMLNDEVFWVNDAWFNPGYEPNNIETILIMPVNFGEDDYVIYLDNFRAIPEPGTLGMILALFLFTFIRTQRCAVSA